MQGLAQLVTAAHALPGVPEDLYVLSAVTNFSQLRDYYEYFFPTAHIRTDVRARVAGFTQTHRTILLREGGACEADIDLLRDRLTGFRPLLSAMN